MNVIVFIDGDSLLRQILRKRQPISQNTDLEKESYEVSATIWSCAKQHIGKNDRLVRIFFYDGPPYVGQMVNPLTGQEERRQKQPSTILRNLIHQKLNRFTNTAVRLGESRYIKDNWQISKSIQQTIIKQSKQITGNTISIEKLQKDDISSQQSIKRELISKLRWMFLLQYIKN